LLDFVTKTRLRAAGSVAADCSGAAVAGAVGNLGPEEAPIVINEALDDTTTALDWMQLLLREQDRRLAGLEVAERAAERPPGNTQMGRMGMSDGWGPDST